MTTFTGVIHRDNFDAFLDIVLPQLLSPASARRTSSASRTSSSTRSKQDLRNNNEEELGKEQLQNVVFAGTPYGHTVLGTVAGIEAITLDDVKKFVDANYNAGERRGRPLRRLSRATLVPRLTREPGRAARRARRSPAPAAVKGRAPQGLEVEIIKKDTRATAISLGHPSR